MVGQQQQQPQKSAKPKATGGAPEGGKQGKLGNAALQQKILGEAVSRAAKDGQQPDMATTLGLPQQEDPGKYHFPEGPDTPAPTTGEGEKKQQADALPKLREKHEGNKSYDTVKDASSFVKGEGDANEVDPNDLKQGALGDCYLIAAMAAVARANPDAIKKLIKDNGNGTFDVTLYIRKNAWSKPTAVTKTVDAQLPGHGDGRQLYASGADKGKDGNGKEGTEIWPALIEKTLAQHKGSYETIQGADIGKNFQFHGATEMLTGKAEGYKNVDSITDDDILLELAAGLEGNKPVTCDTREMTNDEALTKEANALNIYGNHAYAVKTADIDKRMISLQNPWGSHHVDPISVEQFRKFYRGIRVGG